jgi:23S rRNA (guanosine2251-2'-O)-methyltransferase
VTTQSRRPKASLRSLVYGRNPVREALRGRRAVLRVWATRELEGRLPDFGAGPISIVGRAELDRICASPDHQGIACQVGPYPYVDAGSLLNSERAVVIALDQVQDPHNLGAICRSAECAGVTGMVVPERRSAAITPAVCRASAGAVEHLSVARVRNLADFLAQARERGAWIYGAEAEAPVPYTAPAYDDRTVLVLGSEGGGLRPRVRAACDQLVSLPVQGRVQSLNVSAAAAVLIYEILRKRRDYPAAGTGTHTRPPRS